MKKRLVTWAMFGTVLLGAQTVTTFDKVLDWKWPAGSFKNGEITYCDQWRIVSSSPMVRIDPTAQYVFEMEVQSATATAKPQRVALTMAVYDAEKREIFPYNITTLPNTETELVEAVNPGDTILKLKNGKNWVRKNFTSIAFNVKSDFSDLPNREVINANFESFKDNGPILEISLKKPMTKGYPAGTKVRQHLWSRNLTVCQVQVDSQGKWISKSGSISGIGKGGKRDDRKWWPGAVYFRPAITSKKNKYTIRVRNIKVTVKDINSIF